MNITMDEYILIRVLSLLIQRETGVALTDVQAETIGEAIGLLASGLYIDESIWKEDPTLAPLIAHAIEEYNKAR